MAEDDRALMERLAALEAEVKADADAQRARKDAALQRLRVQKAEQTAERDAERDAQRDRLALTSTSRQRATSRDQLDDLGGALELAGKANRVKNELARTPGKGEKSWVKSGGLSLILGPIGWLYAGSFREAAPASAAWVAAAALASRILPSILLMPAILVLLPLSGIAGIVYALQYNRAGGHRQRIFGDDKKPKQLAGK